MSAPTLSRRTALALAGGLGAQLAATTATAMSRRPDSSTLPAIADAPTAPFDSLRDYLAAMEAHNLLARFDRVDQDNYEATAIAYYLTDTFGQYQAPVLQFDEVKVNGQWLRGPLIGNNQSHYHQEALLWGLATDPVEPRNSYRRALDYMVSMLEANGGQYPTLDPVEVDRGQAPCKQITLTGDAVDITRFAFIQGNPGDAGRYINTGSTFTADPEWGQNFGTYRCQIKGPRQIILNSEPNQTGHRMIRRAMARGEQRMPIAIVLGQDPVVWMISGSRVPFTRGKPVDELAVAGGMRGKPLEVVRADTSKLVIPAHAELVIEGEIDLTRLEPEGPYHETYGYLGDRNQERFVVDVTRVTHRRNPVLMNSFTSIGGGFVKAPMDAYNIRFWQQQFPQITGIYYHDDSKGIYAVSIRKDRPGIGLEIANAVVERSLIAKVVVVMDDDLDVMNQSEVLLALGSRWQPDPAATIVADRPASFFEPSSPDGKTTSKIAIDATMQWPEEGGPAEFPALNRNLFEAAAPDAVRRVARKWPDQLLRGRYG